MASIRHTTHARHPTTAPELPLHPVHAHSLPFSASTYTLEVYRGIKNPTRRYAVLTVTSHNGRRTRIEMTLADARLFSADVASMVDAHVHKKDYKCQRSVSSAHYGLY